MFDKIILYSFYALFFLTPLFWTSLNFELFEYNKMILTYGITVVIVGAWVLKIINHKSLIFNRTPLDIPFLLFLGANILSTIFSIDPHTSIWGYYSRSNGGLLSIISYLLLYFAFVSNFPKEKISQLLKIDLTSGLIISIWGILEHFGISPSCLILRGEANDACWVQDVQARVFASLGQPNWMAGYLGMLIFPALYFLLEAKSKVLPKAGSYFLLIIMYLAFTFTYSRGPTLGLIGGMVVFILFYLKNLKFEIFNLNSNFKLKIKNYRTLILVIFSFLIINLLFGSALTSFRLVSKFASPLRPAFSLPSSTTQLENGGTESGQIRFIVWKGALDIFKHYPIFGSGVETFAYSYYQFRPAEHNLTSEWDFLYNKAHNEYLNYLATTGIVGFGTYIGVIFTFVFWCLKNLKFEIFNLNSNFKLKIENYKQLDQNINLLVTVLLAGYISFLIYNMFLFSVVILAIFFYLFPALVFVVTESTKVYRLQLSVISWIYKRSIYTQIAKGFVVLITFYLLYSIVKIWTADTLFAQGERASDLGNPGKAYNYLTQAVELNKNEPFYQSELAFAAASAATALQDSDATLSAQLKDEAGFEMNKVLKENPNNISYYRNAIRTYFELSSLDKSYTEKTLSALDKAISLAPTDPKLYYNKAIVLQFLDQNDEARETFEKAYLLKPNYLEAKQKLEEATASAK